MSKNVVRFKSPTFLSISGAITDFDLSEVCEAIASKRIQTLRLTKMVNDQGMPKCLSKGNGEKYSNGIAKVVFKSVSVYGAADECLVINALVQDDSGKMPEGVIKAMGYDDDDNIILNETGKIATLEADIPLEQGATIIELALIPEYDYCQVLTIRHGDKELEFGYNAFYEEILINQGFYPTESRRIVTDNDIVMDENATTSSEGPSSDDTTDETE